MEQVEMVSLEDLTSHSHTYRRFTRIWSFQSMDAMSFNLKRILVIAPPNFALD